MARGRSAACRLRWRSSLPVLAPPCSAARGTSRGRSTPSEGLQSRNGRSLHFGPMSEQTDVAALFERLKQEVHAAGPRGADVPPAQVRLSVRDQAERLWPISAERPIVGKGGPVKGLLRRLMRWYVEPAFADQRAFNDAVLKLIDDLDERISRLETK